MAPGPFSYAWHPAELNTSRGGAETFLILYTKRARRDTHSVLAPRGDRTRWTLSNQLLKRIEADLYSRGINLQSSSAFVGPNPSLPGAPGEAGHDGDQLGRANGLRHMYLEA
jgi:hypothetical protein